MSMCAGRPQHTERARGWWWGRKPAVAERAPASAWNQQALVHASGLGRPLLASMHLPIRFRVFTCLPA